MQDGVFFTQVARSHVESATCATCLHIKQLRLRPFKLVAHLVEEGSATTHFGLPDTRPTPCFSAVSAVVLGCPRQEVNTGCSPNAGQATGLTSGLMGQKPQPKISGQRIALKSGPISVFSFCWVFPQTTL
uniref:Uncharacterized protein n=1 Tax=Sphaerodactylus townsendi TaxID=933632 RepID=A0ACB8G574_9SAUR